MAQLWIGERQHYTVAARTARPARFHRQAFKLQHTGGAERRLAAFPA
jgi:hypothetical protein